MDQRAAPWYGTVHPDTALVFEAGAGLVPGRDGASLLDVSLWPIRRGPFEFALVWGAVFSRFGEAQAWGVADPKVYGRVRFPTPSSWFFRFYLEGAARLPVARAELFPYAFGGQDLELSGVLELGGLVLGGGRQMTEPPAGSELTSGDVPHANHFWVLFSRRHGNFLAQLRGDALLFELEDRARWVFLAQAVHGRPQGLTLRFTARAEAGPDRLFDGALEIAFATAIR